MELEVLEVEEETRAFEIGDYIRRSDGKIYVYLNVFRIACVKSAIVRLMELSSGSKCIGVTNFTDVYEGKFLTEYKNVDDKYNKEFRYEKVSINLVKE